MADFRANRGPAVAGQFYPGTAAGLSAEVESCLQAGRGDGVRGRVRALIVPHAGTRFSGPTAGKAFALLEGMIGVRRVVVLAPSHRVGFRGVSVGNYAGFDTPLGTLPVDTALCRALLAANRLFTQRCDAHEAEHSLEVQLPFVQRTLPEAMLVPLLCGDLSVAEIRSVAGALARVAWREDTVWVVSSDFTHFGKAFDYVPFTRQVLERIEELDKGALACIVEPDAEAFLRYIEDTGATICGRIPVAVLLAAIEPLVPDLQCRVLGYTTSGELTHDATHSVSYASLAVVQVSGGGLIRNEAPAATQVLDAAERRRLLALARQSIDAGLRGEEIALPDESELGPALWEQGACFVSLHIAGNLRGCIGSLEAREPLVVNVLRNARNAAVNDYRFAPLTRAELAKVEIEISVLTPNRRIDSVEQFEVGRHGIILEKGRHRAVFLPQVAPQQEWDRETTLDHLALKAGLNADGWRRGAAFHVFEAVVFNEAEFGK